VHDNEVESSAQTCATVDGRRADEYIEWIHGQYTSAPYTCTAADRCSEASLMRFALLYVSAAAKKMNYHVVIFIITDWQQNSSVFMTTKRNDKEIDRFALLPAVT